MRFKQFMHEDANSQETGLFVNVSSKDSGKRVPSDGQPFAKYLNITSGSKNGNGSGPMFMKKKMKKN